MIKDSGTRHQFPSGAVRDVQEGRGRCDLLPLKQVGYFVDNNHLQFILNSLDEFNKNQDKHYLICAIQVFIKTAYPLNSFGEAMIDLSKHFEAGAKKYDERNWEKGIPINNYINSCVRHLLQWYDGKTDEPHDRAVLWNLFCCMWTLENVEDD